MSALRAPVFGGVAAGVGTTTLARALHGVDGGLAPGGLLAGGAVPDVLVCRVDSLARVAGLASPVLAVVADRAPRLDRIAGRFGAIVTVPDVSAWHGLDDPEVAGLLAVAPGRRPARLQPFVDALLAVTAALLRSGVLARPGAAGRGTRRAAPAAPGVDRTGRTGVPGNRGVPPARPPARPVPPRPVAAPAAATPVVGYPAAAAPVPTPPVPTPPVPAPTTPPPNAPVPVTARRGGPVRVVPVPIADGALWRGLRAVERAPVPLRTAPPAPVPLLRSAGTAPVPVQGHALRLRPDDAAVDDDTLESMRAG